MSFGIGFTDVVSGTNFVLIGNNTIGVAFYEGWFLRLKNTAFRTNLSSSDTITDTLYITPTGISSQNYQSSWVQRTDTNTPVGTVKVFMVSSGKLHYAKIWDDGELIRSFVPVRRNSDNKCGMYDTVSGTFFGSATSTAFTCP